uniref:BCL2 interacting killer n=1 Tax=Sinocyclocheilus grahami TaxID=75366 RepID=A0A672K5L7_SINGR
MVEETKQRKNATSLQAGPGEVDHNTLFFGLNSRVSQRIGRQLALIGDELDNKWREQLPLQWQPLNFGIYPYVLTRRAFSGRIFNNVWGSKMMPMLRTSWLVPQLQNGCQVAKKWAALVWTIFILFVLLNIFCGNHNIYIFLEFFNE